MLNIKTERVADLSLINGLLLTNEAEADVQSLVGGGGSHNKQLFYIWIFICCVCVNIHLKDTLRAIC